MRITTQITEHPVNALSRRTADPQKRIQEKTKKEKTAPTPTTHQSRPLPHGKLGHLSEKKGVPPHLSPSSPPAPCGGTPLGRQPGGAPHPGLCLPRPPPRTTAAAATAASAAAFKNDRRCCRLQGQPPPSPPLPPPSPPPPPLLPPSRTAASTAGRTSAGPGEAAALDAASSAASPGLEAAEHFVADALVPPGGLAVGQTLLCLRLSVICFCAGLSFSLLRLVATT